MRLLQVVIMLVIDKENDRALLSRQSRFVPRMWSCLAGFMEVCIVRVTGLFCVFLFLIFFSDIILLRSSAFHSQEKAQKRRLGEKLGKRLVSKLEKLYTIVLSLGQVLNCNDTFLFTCFSMYMITIVHSPTPFPFRSILCVLETLSRVNFKTIKCLLLNEIQ